MRARRCTLDTVAYVQRRFFANFTDALAVEYDPAYLAPYSLRWVPALLQDEGALPLLFPHYYGGNLSVAAPAVRAVHVLPSTPPPTPPPPPAATAARRDMA